MDDLKRATQAALSQDAVLSCGLRSALCDQIIEEVTASAVDVDAWLHQVADSWPEAHRPPPQQEQEALDPAGPWGASAFSVEIRDCAQAAKGKGAFMTRDVPAGSLVGVYYGEALTRRQWAVRHGWSVGKAPEQLTDDEAQANEERRARLLAHESIIAGGIDNGGSYVFDTLQAAVTRSGAMPATLEDKPVYVDAEDPSRSTWCRFINHAHYASTTCNISPRSDPSGTKAGRPIVWFVARRDIKRGEELMFCCAIAGPTAPKILSCDLRSHTASGSVVVSCAQTVRRSMSGSEVSWANEVRNTRYCSFFKF